MPSSSRTLEGPPPSFSDTPPSTRPSSSASSASSGLPTAPSRTLSMDSLSTTPAGGGAPEKVEHIPTRTVGTGPKVNTNAMIFVKTGPAKLYVSATEQMKKAENIKNMRKKVVHEEEEPEWQQSSSSSSSSAAQDDWQSNLDKWKQKRNRNNKDVLERVLEVKKGIVESQQNARPKRSSKVGLRNLVVHDDDNDDLSEFGLGLNSSSTTTTNTNNTDDHTSLNNSRNEPNRATKITTSTTTSSNRIQSSTPSLSSPPSSLTADGGGGGGTGIHAKDILLDHDNKDAKSDAGFCTGSDTGSDGVFPEDNISDTSSALGDKKEPHDSLLDAAVPSSSSKDEDLRSSSSAADGPTSGPDAKDHEYTFDKAIEGYKQYAENSFKKRTSSMTSLTSVSSSSSRLEDRSKYDSSLSVSAAAAAAAKSVKIEDKLDFFKKEMDKEYSKPPPKPIVVMREKSPKIDVTKRKSMFEAGQSISTMNLTNIDSTSNSNLDKRRSQDMTASTGNLRNKLASFENVDTDAKKQKGVVVPPRDTKFKEKLANFSAKSIDEISAPNNRKKTPEKDKNFHQKLASFSKIQNGSTADESKNYDRRSSIPAQLNNTASLKSKIASFEQLDQHDPTTDFRLSDSGSKAREKSVSMECLSRSSATTRRLESRFSRGSVDRLDEEPSTESPPSSWGRSSSSHQPRSPEKTSYESRFSSETRSYQSRSPEKRPFVAPCTASSVQERRSQLEKKSVETVVTKSSEVSRSSRVSESQQSFSKTFEESPTLRTAYSGATPPLGSNGGPPEVPPLDLTHSQTEAPIGTSSPRTDSSSSQRTGVEVSTSSSSFSSSVAKTSSSFSTTTSSSKMSRSFAVDDDDEVHYDDVLNTAEQPSLASSSEGDRLRYTDDDINEVILEAEGSSRPRGAAPSPTPRNKDVVETKTSFSISQSSSKVAEAPLSPPPAVPSVAPSLKSSPAFAFKSSPVLAPLPVTPVVFEDWADDHGGSVAPPSEPPPPPPPDSSDAEDSDAAPSSPSPARVGGGAPLSQDTLQRGGSPTPSDCPSLPLSEAYASSDTSSKTSAKEELRKRRSDFLGTSRFSDDVSSPPPDLDVLLRQQREADKKMLEARKALTQSSHQVMSNIDSRHQALSAASSMDSTAGARDRYTWQDRLRADSSQPTAALDDTDDGYDYQNVTSTSETSASKTSTTETSTIVTSTSETSAIVTSSSETSSAKTTNFETSVANTSTPDTKVPSSGSHENTALLGTVTSDEATPDNGPTASHPSGCVTLDSKQTLTSDSPSDAPLDAPCGAPLDAPCGAPSDAPSDAIKGTYTVLDSFPTDKLPESSSVVPSSQPPAAGADVPTEQPKKLAELEAEMMRHDRSVMSRSRTQQQSSTVTPSAPYGGDLPSAPYGGDLPPATDPADPATVTYDDVLAPTDSYNYQDGGDVTRQQTTLDTSVTSCSTDDYYEQHRQSQLKQQFFQQQQQHQQQQQQQVTEATYQNEEFYQQRIQQQQQQQQQMVGDLAYSGADYYQQHRDQQQQQQQQYPVETGPEKPLRTYNPCYDSSAPAPEPLPRKMKPPPPPEEDRYESVSSSSSAQQQQFLTKQSRNALSATPRSRITDGESWIKRKPEANRDYNKHWLYQEAEQRRLEQRDTRNSQKKDQKVPQQPPQHHQQQLNNHSSAQYTASSSSYSSNMSRVESRSSDALQRSSSSDFGGLNRALDPHGRTASVDHALNRGPPVPEPHPSHRPQQEAPVNRNTDPNAWRNRAMTYQPLPPGGSAPHVSGSTDKPLPDAIINTLTQRVNNKSRPGSASNSSGRPSPYSTGTSTSGYGTIGYSNDENYHDYMNADAISNMQQQQQQQQQTSHYQQTYSSAEPANHQQLYSSNSYSSSQQTFNNNNNNNTNGNHEHFAQHLQVSPTASLPLSSSSSTLSTQQQQHYSKPQHSYPNNNTTHQSPQSSPPSAKVAPPPTSSTQNSLEERQRLLSVSGKKKCSHCHKELGRGAAMIIESLRLYYHIPCFVCCVCGVQLSNGKKGADVNVRNHGVHCRNCYSNDQGVKFSEV